MTIFTVFAPEQRPALARSSVQIQAPAVGVSVRHTIAGRRSGQAGLGGQSLHGLAAQAFPNAVKSGGGR